MDIVSHGQIAVGVGVIDRLGFSNGRACYEEYAEFREHLVDVETGEVIEVYDSELESLKEFIVRHIGYYLVDYRLELFGRKIE